MQKMCVRVSGNKSFAERRQRMPKMWEQKMLTMSIQIAELSNCQNESEI